MSELIKTHRQLKRLSMEELGGRIGVSYQMVQKWEKGVNKPTLEQIPLLSQELDIPLIELLVAAGLKPEAANQLSGSPTTQLPFFSAVSQATPLIWENSLPQIREMQPVANGLLDSRRQYIVIEVADPAMSPQLQVGSRVLARLIDPARYMYETGGVYAIYYADRLNIRRIKQNTLRQQQALTLEADNASYGSLTVEQNDIVALWQVLSTLYQPVH